MKKSEEIAEKIAVTKEYLANLENQMDQALPNAFIELSTVTREWINSEVGRTIEKKPAQIATLGAEKLHGLKSNVDLLVTDFRSWLLTQRPLPASQGDIFDNAFRSMTGSLGHALATYGLIDVHSPDSEWKRVGDNWSQRYGPNLPSPLPEIGKWRLIEKKKQRALEEIGALESALNVAKAKELWESA